MKKVLLLLPLLVGSWFAFADSIQPYDGSSTYFNFNTGLGKLYDMPTGAWTGNINWGYNLNRGFALEGGYNLFASSEYGATVASNIFDIAAKGTIPLSDVFNLYGRFGFGIGNTSWTGTAVGDNSTLCIDGINTTYGVALLGAGGSFTLNRHWDLRLEDTVYIPWENTSTGTLMALTFGAQYNF